MTGTVFRQIIYCSDACGFSHDDLADILTRSHINNGLDGVSGLLWTNGQRYVQLLEGPPESVETTFARIGRDPRHEKVTIIADAVTAERAFGDWTMADLSNERNQLAGSQLAVSLATAPSEVRSIFTNLV